MLSLTDSGLTSKEPGSKRDRRRGGPLAHAIYQERTRRANFFPPKLFGEPAWDILLDLYAAAESNELRSIKEACLASNVPEATALRYIEELVEYGLAQRKPDRTDKRRKYLSLTPLGERQMRDYLASMPPIGDSGEDLIRYLVLPPG